MPSNAFFRHPTETEKNRVFRVRKKWDGKWDGANKMSFNPSRIPSKHTLFFLNIRPDYTLFLSRAQKVVRKSGKSSKKTMKSSKKILFLLNEHPANSGRKLALHSVSEWMHSFILSFSDSVIAFTHSCRFLVKSWYRYIVMSLYRYFVTLWHCAATPRNYSFWMYFFW